MKYLKCMVADAIYHNIMYYYNAYMERGLDYVKSLNEVFIDIEEDDKTISIIYEQYNTGLISMKNQVVKRLEEFEKSPAYSREKVALKFYNGVQDFEVDFRARQHLLSDSYAFYNSMRTPDFIDMLNDLCLSILNDVTERVIKKFHS